MSDIPFEIQSEIMKRVPVKSLLQFRSVSKTWKSLIDSSAFIASYRGQQQLMLMNYDCPDEKNRYISIVDDHTFPQQNVPVTIPVNCLKYTQIIGCSHGLLCLYGKFLECRDGHIYLTHKAAIWNISVRKAVEVVVPNMEDGTTLTFGVCRETNDPKIVKIACTSSEIVKVSINSIPWVVEVFTLSTGAWRRWYRNLTRYSAGILYRQEVITIDGVVYCLAYVWYVSDGRCRGKNLVVTFDFTSEEFGEVNLPDSLHQSNFNLSVSELRGSLVVLEGGEVSGHLFVVVWMLEDGVSKSFKKLFTINLPEDAVLRGFRKSGEPIIEIVERENCGGLLAVYEPNSRKMDNVVDGGCSFYVDSYMETLLLLDKPSFIVYNDT